MHQVRSFVEKSGTCIRLDSQGNLVLDGLMGHATSGFSIFGIMFEFDTISSLTPSPVPPGGVSWEVLCLGSFLTNALKRWHCPYGTVPMALSLTNHEDKHELK